MTYTRNEFVGDLFFFIGYLEAYLEKENKALLKKLELVEQYVWDNFTKGGEIK